MKKNEAEVKTLKQQLQASHKEIERLKNNLQNKNQREEEYGQEGDFINLTDNDQQYSDKYQDSEYAQIDLDNLDLDSSDPRYRVYDEMGSEVGIRDFQGDPQHDIEFKFEGIEGMDEIERESQGDLFDE